ncbi:hypothetical protein P168DRAFT_297665 [Aspergillus campestris IBT 28561]|uniref:Uncharacterized protein n=1 Tax=Aspergillus campestris (strain IBT 28561) TaxID=1392248 RepID=A0A2I1D1P7_ASPC2|nr:uncharacterized protein P168DRAFT_297665 [Aspergillus campestris IBT 28561]PKY03786.1 hypothetical protein P168DRAFT_297665 [Aspergillus campestris IBT 28561]
MAVDFTFHGQSLDNSLVASISSLLDSIHVPNLLWGNYLLTIYGISTIVDGAAFVVPDNSIDVSYSVLLNAGFLRCTKSTESTHLHIKEEIAILIYRNSDVLPDLPYLLPPARLGYGQGRLEPQFFSIRIPTALTYCKALIYLRCRDRGRTTYGMYWLVMLTYIVEYADGTDIFHEEDLSEVYRPSCYALQTGEPRDMYSISDGLRC